MAEEVAEEFIGLLKEEFIRQTGRNPLKNPEYPCLISDAAYKKCSDEAAFYRDRIIFGGEGDVSSRKFAPTLIYPVSYDEPIVQHELFCPSLPVVPYPDENIDEILKVIADREHPYSGNKGLKMKLIRLFER